MSWWYKSNPTLARERGIVVRVERVGPGRWRATAYQVRPDPHSPGDYLLGEPFGYCEASTRYRARNRLTGPLPDYTSNPNKTRHDND